MKICRVRLMRISFVSWLSCLSLAMAFILLWVPVPVTHAQPLEVKLISLTSPVSAGEDAVITIQTTANANCQISVQYKSGPSRAKGLVPKTADSKGQLSWTWRVGSRTTPGTWPITVTCSKNDQQQMFQTSFVVR